MYNRLVERCFKECVTVRSFIFRMFLCVDVGKEALIASSVGERRMESSGFDSLSHLHSKFSSSMR